MSYSNGLGNLQQLFTTTDAAATSAASAPVKAAASAGTSGTQASTPALQADQANLSATAGIVAAALNGSDVRPDKVAALQQSIAAGTYSVSAEDVAGKLLSSLLK